MLDRLKMDFIKEQFTYDCCLQQESIKDGYFTKLSIIVLNSRLFFLIHKEAMLYDPSAVFPYTKWKNAQLVFTSNSHNDEERIIKDYLRGERFDVAITLSELAEKCNNIQKNGWDIIFNAKIDEYSRSAIQRDPLYFLDHSLPIVKLYAKSLL